MTAIGKRFFHLSVTSPAFSRLQEAEEFFLSGNLNEGLAAAQQAWREHPRESDVFRVLAYIHMAREEYHPAAQAAYQAVVLDGDNPASYATLAQVYITFNMLKNLEETLTVARDRFPDDVALMTLAADAYFRRRQDREGVDLASRALQDNPNDGYTSALLGVYRLRKRQYAAAAKLLKDAVAAYPQRWDYLRDYGIALLHTGNYTTACEHLLRSIQLNKLDHKAKRHLFFALKLEKTDTPFYWPVALFFFDYSGLAWTLYIAGLISALVGLLWMFVVLQSHYYEPSLTAPGLLTFVGGILIVLTQTAVIVSRRKGKRFNAQLHRLLKSSAVDTSTPTSS